MGEVVVLALAKGVITVLYLTWPFNDLSKEETEHLTVAEHILLIGGEGSGLFAWGLSRSQAKPVPGGGFQGVKYLGEFL